MPSCVSDDKCCWIVVVGGWTGEVVERWEETMDDDGDDVGDGDES